MSDDELAGRLATAAGELLVEVRGREADPEARKAAGDRESHEMLVAELADLRPNDGLLSEEGANDLSRCANRRAWIIDPLDGTREFGEVPRDDWAVHVALAIDSVAMIGAVALPARGLTLRTGGPLPAPSASPGRPRIVVSRTRPTSQAVTLAEALDGELLPMGSAGAKAMAVVLGEAEIYAHSGGQYEWDSAAPVAVAAAAGFHVSRLDGSPLVYNQPNPWLPDLLICHPAFAEQVIALCQGELS